MSADRKSPAYDDEPQFPEEPADNSAAMLIGVGAVAFIIGLFLWWSVVSSFTDSGESVFDDTLATTPVGTQAPAVSDDATQTLNCDDFGPQRALSAEREAAYQAQCVSPTPEPGETPTPDTRLNRESCEDIRGTDYRSPEERTWFLANCVTN